MTSKNNPEQLNKGNEKIHPWKLCPAGEHWVRTHPMRVPPRGTTPAKSKKGGLTNTI